MDTDYLTQLREAHAYEVMAAFDTALLRAINVVNRVEFLTGEQKDEIARRIGQIKR